MLFTFVVLSPYLIKVKTKNKAFLMCEEDVLVSQKFKNHLIIMVEVRLVTKNIPWDVGH